MKHFILLLSLLITCNPLKSAEINPEKAWDESAENTAKDWFWKNESVRNPIALEICRIIVQKLHPTAHDSRTEFLPDTVKIVKNGPIIDVSWKLKWEGGLGSARDTEVQWKLTERQSLAFNVLADNGAFGVAEDKKIALKNLFQEKFHTLFVKDVKTTSPYDIQWKSQLTPGLAAKLTWEQVALTSYIKYLTFGKISGQFISKLTGVPNTMVYYDSITATEDGGLLTVKCDANILGKDKPVTVTVKFTKNEALPVQYDGKPAPQKVTDTFTGDLWPIILKTVEEEKKR